ncbi:hypothetical protein SQ11_01080 [Nitrosospira sp. NpAV]|nr:hypothetical protein SQ11_01080 [Nitrosospira sp. NpAV]
MAGGKQVLTFLKASNRYSIDREIDEILAGWMLSQSISFKTRRLPIFFQTSVSRYHNSVN